jgi:hypothetical protein
MCDQSGFPSVLYVLDHNSLTNSFVSIENKVFQVSNINRSGKHSNVVKINVNNSAVDFDSEIFFSMVFQNFYIICQIDFVIDYNIND